MATLRQKRLAAKIIENRGNASKSMIEVGYSAATAHNPQQITNSKGFQELCDELGLTDNLLVTALVSDIKKKPKNRKAELELGFKVRGKLQDVPGGNKTLIVVVTGQSANRYGAVASPSSNSS